MEVCIEKIFYFSRSVIKGLDLSTDLDSGNILIASLAIIQQYIIYNSL